ncbi:hypothetical protein [Pleomorphovibrio marinus]|uniref:hypothetical protein n=1 Tax=Pleomorphovibrio marinus TaxID=2164132 RepID=UPI000E0AB5D1|nr:hypothetical protein [Pleomorphovibrio marinus]
MKKQDIDRLKALCDKEGFELERVPNLGHSELFTINPKKDPWDGCEFVECVDNTNSEGCFTVGRIYKVIDNSNINKYYNIRNNDGDGDGWYGLNKERFKPSTEHEYVLQLITESNEKLGDCIYDDQIRNLDFSEMKGGALADQSTKWKYQKDTDTLYFYGHPVYQQGKWATKLPEKPTVKAEGGNIDSGHFHFIMNDAAKDKCRKIGCWETNELLAQQLEKYLNQEP